MSSEQLSTRILAEQSRIKSNDIRRGKISEEQFEQFIETSKDISNFLYILMKPQQLALQLYLIEQDELRGYMVWIC